MDNVFFYTADSGGTATEPTAAAPAPTQDAANVTSVFSNAYSDVAGTNPRAFGNDGGASFSEIQVAGDDVWSYGNTNFVGLQNDGGFDARTNFSMDIWVAEDVSFRAGLISFTDPVSREDVEVNLTGGQWNNIDVALADLVPSLGSEGPLPDSPTINQIIFDVLGDGVEANIFVDNVFFYTADSGGSGTVFSEDFSTDTSGNWTPLADAAGKPTEVNVNYLADGGETGGGLEFVLVNATGGAFIYRLQEDGIDFSGLTNAEFQFSLKLSEALVSTAIQSQLQVLGSTNVDISENNLETKGLNDATFTEFTIPFTVPEGATGTIFFDINLATGNPGAGGVIIDNIRIVEATN